MNAMGVSMPDLVRHSATELSALIHKREVSCAEVMRAYLKQIEDCNPALNAIVGLRSHDDLLSEARARDAELARGIDRGWMHGMPHAIKDLTAAKGLPHTMGSPIFAGRIAQADDLVAKRIRIVGRHHADHAVLQVMHAYERATPWLARVPDMIAGPS